VSSRERLRVASILVLVVVPIIPTPALGRQNSSPVYAGRPLDAVLRDLQRQGLNLVFSSELVRPALKVDKEPKATTLRKIAKEVLKPHALEL